MRAPRIGSLRVFDPVLFDRLRDNTRAVPAGTLVRVIQPHGCPKNGTMGMCYVEYAGAPPASDHKFIGLACINSLQPR